MSYLTWPACSDIVFNPMTCYDCGGLRDTQGHRCRKCQIEWQDRSRESIESAVKKMNDYMRGKLPDRNYSRIIFASVWLITFGYAILIYWCLTR